MPSKSIRLTLHGFLLFFCLFVGHEFIVHGQSATQEAALGAKGITVEGSPDGTLIAVGTENGVKIYDTDLQEVTTLPDYTEQVISLSWNPDSHHLAGVGYPYEYDITFLYVPVITSSLLIWQRDSNNNFSLEHRIDYPDQNNVVQVKWNPSDDKMQLATRESEYLPRGDLAFGSITIWDTTTWTSISTLQNTYREMYGEITWSPDGTFLAGGGEAWCYELRPCNMSGEPVFGDIIFVIDPATGQRIAFSYTGAQVYTIAWSTINQIAIAAVGLRIYDSSLTTIIGEKGSYRLDGLEWLPTQTELLLWSRDGEINIVDSTTFESRYTLVVPELQALSLSADGSQIVALSAAQTISIYPLPD